MQKVKACTRCGIEKVESLFYKSSDTRDGLQYACKECQRIKQLEWANKNRERHRANGRKHYYKDHELSKLKNRLGYSTERAYVKKLKQYNLTLEEYDSMFKSQQGLCAICQNAETQLNPSGEIKRLCVDHCHTTGQVRELLCTKCNKALGGFRDDPSLLLKAMEYLQKKRD